MNDEVDEVNDEERERRARELYERMSSQGKAPASAWSHTLEDIRDHFREVVDALDLVERVREARIGISCPAPLTEAEARGVARFFFAERNQEDGDEEALTNVLWLTSRGGRPVGADAPCDPLSRGAIPPEVRLAPESTDRDVVQEGEGRAVIVDVPRSNRECTSGVEHEAYDARLREGFCGLVGRMSDDDLRGFAAAASVGDWARRVVELEIDRRARLDLAPALGSRKPQDALSSP